MSVFRVHKTENYTVMSNYHFRDTKLSLKAKGLLSIMLSLPENWNYSIQGLSTLSSDGETSVRSGLQELEEHNYLKRTPIREKGIIRDWQYDIYEVPCTPVVENPIVDNLAQLNTNIINTKEINKDNTSTKVEVEEKSSKRKSLIGTITSNPDSINNKKKNKYEQCLDEIDKFTGNKALREVLTTYLRLRLEMRESPMYKNQWIGMLKKLRELSDTDDGMIEIVQQSINRGYKGFFEVKKYNKQNKGQDQSVFSEFGKVRTGRGAGGNLVNVQF